MPKKSNPQNPEDSKKWENPNKIDDEEMDIYDDPEDNLNINEIIEGKRHGTIKKKEDEE